MGEQDLVTATQSLIGATKALTQRELVKAQATDVLLKLIEEALELALVGTEAGFNPAMLPVVVAGVVSQVRKAIS